VNILRAGLILSLLLLGTALALMAYPPLIGAAYWLRAAPGSQCNAAETVRSVAYHRKWNRVHEQIAGGARMLRAENGMQLWDVPGMREFWIHGTFDRMNGIAFAEQAAGQYWHPSVHIQPGDIVFDVGADYGSVTFEALAAGARKVVAVEVAPYKWECLERTFAKEIADGRVVLMKAGAWDSESTLELGGDSVVLDRGQDKQKVRVYPIDRMVAELNLPRVDFISMDIEGAEKPALRGAADTLRRFHPRMAIASEHLPDDVTAIPATVRGIVPGYEVFCGQCDSVNGRLLAQVIWFR